MRDIPLPNESILLATDGLKATDAVVCAAADVADVTGHPVIVLAVLEPPPLVAGEYGFVIPLEPVAEDRRHALLARVRNQLRDVLGRNPKWPIVVRSGNPATTIAQAAEDFGAVLIVMGLGHHHMLDRALGAETALHTLRAARTPLFAVPQRYAGLPHRALVAVDFGDAGLAAAKHALALLPTLTHMTLVHVGPRWDMQPAAYAEWRAEYERGLMPAFERLVRELDAPPGVAVTTTIREGKTTNELLAAAEQEEADVIIVGSTGLGFLDRLLVGSTASGILRGAQDAVFAFPIVALATRPVASGAAIPADACMVGA